MILSVNYSSCSGQHLVMQKVTRSQFDPCKSLCKGTVLEQLGDVLWQRFY